MTRAQTLLVLALMPITAALLAGTLGACVAAIVWVGLAIRADATRSLIVALAARQSGPGAGRHLAMAVA